MTRRTPTARDTPPDFFTVEEAAVILRIGRTAAYGLARQYVATDGEAGLPVVRFGKQLRVPRYKLEGFLGGPVTWPIPTDDESDEPTDSRAPRQRGTRSRPPRPGDEPQLFTVGQ